MQPNGKASTPHKCAYCQEEYPSKRIFSHFKQCGPFKENFKQCVFELTDLFDQVQKSSDIEPLVMFEDVLNNFLDHIHKQYKKRGHQLDSSQAAVPAVIPAPIAPRPMPAARPPPPEEEKEEKKEPPKPVRKPPPAAFNDSHAAYHEPAVPMVKCVGACGQMFPDGTLLYLNECLHTICLECLEALSFEHIVTKKMGTSPAACPQCQARISRQEFEMYLGAPKYKEFIDLYEKSLLGGLETVRCPKPECKNVMILEGAGKIDYNQKDESGKPLSKAACEHFAQHRIRCSACGDNFCKSCSENPYHIGMTCEEHKKFKESKHCRFCDNMIKGKSADPNPAFKDVCNSVDCQKLKAECCTKMLTCGHPCNGEKKCLPCLQSECADFDESQLGGASGEDYCGICFICSLTAEPCVKLDCGHVFHSGCIIKKLQTRYMGPRITFGFAQCPSCRQFISCPTHPGIDREMKEIMGLYKIVCEKSLQRLKHEGYDKDKRLQDPKDQFYNDPQKYALRKLSYFKCFKCKIPYFGGLRDCRQADDDARQFKQDELLCGKCSSVVAAGVTNCKLHGKEFIDYKCKFCCSVASWFCWGTTHFCDECHKRQNNGDYLTRKKEHELPQCGSVSKCPLKVKHPNNGKEEFALGCSVCRNNSENYKEF